MRIHCVSWDIARKLKNVRCREMSVIGRCLLTDVPLKFDWIFFKLFVKRSFYASLCIVLAMLVYKLVKVIAIHYF